MSDDVTWASYEDLLKVKKESLNKALSAAQHYCYDAVNLEFSLHSSTSGMYPSWHINVSPACTVYLCGNPPAGKGSDFNKALEDFATKMEAFCKEKGLYKEDRGQWFDYLDDETKDFLTGEKL